MRSICGGRGALKANTAKSEETGDCSLLPTEPVLIYSSNSHREQRSPASPGATHHARRAVLLMQLAAGQNTRPGCASGGAAHRPLNGSHSG